MTMEIVSPQTGYETQRRWSRFKVDVPVRLIAERQMTLTTAQGLGTDICVGGMAVLAGIEVSLSDQVEVEFTPPYTSEPLRIRGLVRNRSGHRFGIEFITENDADYNNVGQLETILTLSES